MTYRFSEALNNTHFSQKSVLLQIVLVKSDITVRVSPSKVKDLQRGSFDRYIGSVFRYYRILLDRVLPL